jgi:hypothetical protein
MALGLFESLAQTGIHVATVTLAASVVPGSKEVDAVAELFWTLHSPPRDKWTAEVKYAW